MPLPAPRSLVFCISLAAAALCLVGCNAFSGLDDRAGDTEALFEDAKVALQQDQPEEAERQLRAVLEKDPDHEPARVKLATTLLRKKDINVIDFVRLGRALNEELGGTILNGSTSRATLAPTVSDSHRLCSFPSEHAREAFDPASLAGIDALMDSQDVFGEVQELIRTVMDDATPQAFAETAEHSPLGVDLIAEALLNAAIAHAADAFVRIAQSGGESFSFYYVTPPGGESYLGYCAPTQAVLDAVLNTMACLLNDLDYGRQIIRARAELLDSDRARDLADQADEAYEVLVRELDATCSGSAPSVATAYAETPSAARKR